MNIESQFNEINNALFRVDSEIPYPELIDKFIDLGNTLADTETEENIWYIGEGTECCLDDLIVGAYWHFTEWHGGQNSYSYAALCALGRVFSPGMADGPEDDTSEHYVYKALEELAKDETKD